MLAAGRLALCLMLLLFPACGGVDRPQDSSLPMLTRAREFEGRKIESVAFEPADQPLSQRDLQQRLALRAGEPFRVEALRETIRNLFASGRYSDLAVDATERSSGVRLRFLTKRAYFVGRVSVLGVKQPPNSGQLVSATKLRLGRPYVDNDRSQAVEALQSLLRQDGLYSAHVQSGVTYDQGTESADLKFVVDQGDRAQFSTPVITGHPEFPVDQLIRATRWKRLYGLLGWQQVTETRTRQGVDNLKHYYEKRDRLQSRVVLEGLHYRPADNTIQPHLDLESGPRITVAVTGASIGRGELNQLVPIYQEESVDPDLLLEGQRNIEQYLQADGYFGAKVDYLVKNLADSRSQIITYQVDRGSRHKFVHLQISGNRYFSEQTLRARLYIEPAQFPRFPYGRFSPAYLKQDLQSIQDLYTSNGFRDVKVTSRVVDDYRGAKNRLAAFIQVDEGTQWFVSKLSIEGVDAADQIVLRSQLASIPGQPFSAASISNDRDTCLTYFYGRGFLNATFDFYETAAGESHRMEIRYSIDPGERHYVRNVIVTGLETTRRNLVFSRIGLEKGQPLSLTQETDSQRRLYDLGIFARVNTALQNPNGDEVYKTVLYDIDEARHYSLNVGVGAQIARIGGSVTSLDNPAGTTGFAPRLALGLSRINFLGLGQTLGFQSSISTIEQRGVLTYFIPEFVSNANLNLTVTGLIENSNDIRTYTAYRREASIQLGQRISRAYTAQYRLVFRNVTLSNLKIDRLLVPLLAQPESLGLGEVSLIQDKRDDPADAHRGIYSTVDLSYAPRFLGSQTSFVRGLFRNSTYYPFRRDVVFARSTQFGVISRISGASTIPLAERIYSGGSTSLRSFPDFQAGPRDLQTGFPLGGNALFVNNFELRFPLFGDNVGGVLFEDAGNVYSSLGDFSFRFRQDNLQDFNYMVQSAGFGIRYKTPIGPVRLDFSFSPNAPRFFGLKGDLNDLINGTAVSTVQKINSFQFHFSLGQAF